MTRDTDKHKIDVDFDFSSFLTALSGEHLPSSTYRAPRKQEPSRRAPAKIDEMAVETTPESTKKIPGSRKTNFLPASDLEKASPEEKSKEVEDFKAPDTAKLEEEEKKKSERIALSHIPIKAQFTLEQLLETMIKERASDLHISTGSVPSLRIDGEITLLQLPDIDLETTEELLLPILNDEQREMFEEVGDLDFSIDYCDGGRFRVNYFKHYRGMGGLFRYIPLEIPELDELGLPRVVKNLIRFKKGLILVAGPKGQGKTTTMASMLNEINKTKRKRIITLENPIEYLFTNDKSLVSQREIGTSTIGYTEAIRAVLREDPDVIMVSELWEPDDIRQILKISETGHLVMTTMKTVDCPGAVERLVDIFPQNEQEQIRITLSETLIGVIAQNLIPKADGQGRALACEILLATTGLVTLIREGKFNQIGSTIQTGRDLGMQTIDQSLLELIQNGIITSRAAKNFMTDERFFRRAGISID